MARKRHCRHNGIRSIMGAFATSLQADRRNEIQQEVQERGRLC